MNYREFLGVVFAPVLVVVAFALVIRIARYGRGDYPVRTGLACVGILIPVAVVFTTPWDSWLIANSVWWYPPNSVLGTVFRVPFEEYLFMMGLTALTGWWTILVTLRAPAVRPSGPTAQRERLLIGLAWLVVAAVGTVAVLATQRGTYLGSLLAWFGIPLALQAFYGADVLRGARRQRLAGLALTPLLWVLDAFAIHVGSWQISGAHTVGVSFAGLPLEEMVFFLLVDLLVVNSVVLVTHPAMSGRIPRWHRRSRAMNLVGTGAYTRTEA